MEKIELFLENFIKINGKVFSWLFPVIEFIIAIGLIWGMFYIPEWPGRALFFFFALISLFIGIYLLIKRKKFDW